MAQPLDKTLLSQYRPPEVWIDCARCRRHVTVAVSVLRKKYGNPTLGMIARMVARAGNPPCGLADVPTQELCKARPLEPPFHHWATLDQAEKEGWSALLHCQRHFAALKATKPCREASVLDLETLIAVLGHDFPLERLPRRLKCTNCGTEAVEVQWIEPKAVPPPTGTELRPSDPIQLRPTGAQRGRQKFRVIDKKAGGGKA